MAEQLEVEGRYDVNGVVFSTKLSPPGILDRIRKLYIHEDDILVTGYPKSGNMWTLLTLNAIRLGSNDLKKLKEEGARLTEAMGIDFLESLEKVEQTQRPICLLSHLKYDMLPQDVISKNCKIVHIVRNPKDVAVSYYHMDKIDPNLQIFKGSWNTFFEAFSTGNLLYGDYFDCLKDWLKQRDNPNVMILKYEDYKAKPRQTIIALAQFIGVILSNEQVDVIEEVTSFTALKNNPKTLSFGNHFQGGTSSFFRKGEVGDWQNYFSDEQASFIDKKCAEFEKSNQFSLT